MSADAKGLQISVMGREFRVACPENEQKGLLEAVEYLNKKMDEIRDTRESGRARAHCDHGRSQHRARVALDQGRRRF